MLKRIQRIHGDNSVGEIPAAEDTGAKNNEQCQGDAATGEAEQKADRAE